MAQVWRALGLAAVAAVFGCSRPPGVTPAQAAELLRQPGVYLLDVRTPEEYKAGHIEGAALIPLQELGAKGYEVRDLTGGLAAWERAGLPVKR